MWVDSSGIFFLKIVFFGGGGKFDLLLNVKDALFEIHL